jgi:hypothetical protein
MSPINKLQKVINDSGAALHNWIGNALQQTSVSPMTPGHRASGGPVIPNTVYTVGERGPETFVPSQAGTIVPNGRAGAGLDNWTLRQLLGETQATNRLLSQIARRPGLAGAL